MNDRSILPDLSLTLPVILLISLGCVVIYSQDPRLAIQQIIFSIVGMLIFSVVSMFNFEQDALDIKYIYFAILGLLLVTFIVGFETRGSLRWLPLGPFQLQPSELAKPVLILFLARFWSNHVSSWKNIVKSFFLILPILGLIFKQPDLGTTLTIMMIWFVMLVAANISLIKIAIMAIITAVSAPLVWFFLKDYQRNRILSFLSPEQDPLGIGYNVIQSTIAVGSGQIFGRGLGRGTQTRLQFLPEFRTDFIFASIAEELGFLASIIVLGLYGFLIARMFKIISFTKTRFGALIIYGVLGMLFFQITINIGMNIGLVPVTGITLPLLSYGGSSLLSTLISLGLVASVVRYKSQSPSFDDIDT